MDSAYFDSSVFLSIVGKEKSAAKIKLLLSELKKKKIRIVTSIVTVQEVSVKVYQKGTIARDNYAMVNKLARILAFDKDTALTAAKYEAHLLDNHKPADQDKAAENKRRKLDCFHIACAVVNGCGTLYSLDDGMLKRRDQFKIAQMTFLKPEPNELSLDLQMPTLNLMPPPKSTNAKEDDGKQESASLPPA